MKITNQTVITPLGEGIVQGPFQVNDAQGETVVTAVLVRLPINDVTILHLGKSNCVTPRAQVSALWAFQESELK